MFEVRSCGHQPRSWLEPADRGVVVVSDPHKAVPDRDVGRTSANGNRLGGAIGLRVKSAYGVIEFVRDPDSMLSNRDTAWATADPNLGHDLVRLWVYALYSRIC